VTFEELTNGLTITEMDLTTLVWSVDEATLYRSRYWGRFVLKLASPSRLDESFLWDRVLTPSLLLKSRRGTEFFPRIGLTPQLKLITDIDPVLPWTDFPPVLFKLNILFLNQKMPNDPKMILIF